MVARKAVRITVGTADVDVPLGVFSTNQIAQYDGTQFKGVALPVINANTVIGPGASTDNHLALWNSVTGKLLKDTAPVVVDSSGNFTGVGTITSGNVNGVNVAAHAARHLPAGADTVFPGSWSANDFPQWSGAAFAPKGEIVAEVSTLQTLTATPTTLQAITALSIVLPRAGTYWLQAMIMTNDTTTTATNAFGMSTSGSTTRMSLGWLHFLNTGTFVVGPQSAALTVGGTGVASGVRAVGTVLPVYMLGSITVSALVTIQLLASTNTNNLLINTGSAFMATQQ